METDFILNGTEAYGSAADRLIACNMDVGALRPWKDRTGRSFITVNGRGGPKNLVTNTPATLTKDEWIQLDQAVIKAARPLLRVWGDLTRAGLTYSIPNGMGTTVLQYQTMTDAGAATMSMDGLRQSERDRPLFDLKNLPLPLVHGDFSFSAREIAVSRQSGSPLDTVMAEQTTRKVAEQVERLVVGVSGSYTYGGGTIYGLTNYPDRITKVFDLPTGGTWTPKKTADSVSDMIQSAQNNYFNGPYMLYYSPGWTKYLDQDYSATYGGETLRSRLGKVADIVGIQKLDYLTNYQMVLVQMTSDVIRAVTGMGLTTVQWETEGGLKRNFKIMAIMVPQLRSTSDSTTGIVHGTAA